MCTAITYKTKDFYFGRTLDHGSGYVEEVTIVPRRFPLTFRAMGRLEQHYAIMGMAYVVDNYPLFYDAINEKGLAMAGLNLVGYTQYREPEPERDNIAYFELIPWLLAQCATVEEVKARLSRLNLTNIPFSDKLPLAKLHWMIADSREAIAVESLEDGLHVYRNPVGVLTNNPPFGQQMFHLRNYMGLSSCPPENRFSPALELTPYSYGMGALGLPGDLSSQSRFVRAAFTRLNSVSGPSETESVSQFFHILGTVNQTRGCCDMGGGKHEITIYTSCCNADKGIYYYTTYDNHQITAVHLHHADLEASGLVRYPLILEEQIRVQN